LQAVIADPKIEERLAAVGFDAFTSTPEELDVFVREDFAKWATWVKAAGIEPE
jgi:tripartite-type tricarboxylate transporter receptor subunit TctC